MFTRKKVSLCYLCLVLSSLKKSCICNCSILTGKKIFFCVGSNHLDFTPYTHQTEQMPNHIKKATEDVSFRRTPFAVLSMCEIERERRENERGERERECVQNKCYMHCFITTIPERRQLYFPVLNVGHLSIVLFWSLFERIYALPLVQYKKKNGLIQTFR